MTVIFFRALAKEWQLETKTSGLEQSKKNILVSIKEISEMKQTAAMSLGILVVNEDFVYLNEMIKIFTKVNFFKIIKSQNYFGK